VHAGRTGILWALLLLALHACGDSPVAVLPTVDTGAQPSNYFMASDFAAASNSVCSLMAGASDACNGDYTAGPVGAVIVVEKVQDNVNYTVTIDDGLTPPSLVENFTVDSGAGATAASIETALIACINGTGGAPCNVASTLVSATAGSIVLMPLTAAGKFDVSLSDNGEGNSMLVIGPMDADLTAFLYTMYGGFEAPNAADLWAKAVSDMIIPGGFPPASGTALLRLAGHQIVNCNDTDASDGTLRVDTLITVEVDSSANLRFVEEKNTLDFSGCTLTGMFLGYAYDQSVYLDGSLSISIRDGAPSAADPDRIDVVGGLVMQTNLLAGSMPINRFWLPAAANDKLGVAITLKDTDPVEGEGESLSGRLCIGGLNATSAAGCIASGGLPTSASSLGTVLGQ